MISDTQGGLWTQAGSTSPTVGGNYCQLWYRIAATSGPLTVSWSASGGLSYQCTAVAEFSGLNGVIDSSDQAAGTVPTITASATDALVVTLVGMYRSADSITVGGSTQVATQANGHDAIGVAWETHSAPGSYTPAVTVVVDPSNAVFVVGAFLSGVPILPITGTGGTINVVGGASGKVIRAVLGVLGGFIKAVGGTTGAILITGPRLLTVFIDNTDRTEFVKCDDGSGGNGVQRTMQIGGGSKAAVSFTLTQKGTPYRPEQGQEVVIWHRDGYRWFAGVVDNTSEYDYTGSAARNEITVNCVDYGVLCDRVIVGKEYQAFAGNLAAILFGHICTDYLTPRFGISFVWEWDPMVALGDQVYNWITATDVLNGICTASGADWRIDFNKVLHLFPAETGYLTAPFSIQQNDGNWIDMTVSNDSSKYRNRVGVRNNAAVNPLWTDTFHGDGYTRFFITMSPLNSRPMVRVNGVPAVVIDVADFGLKPYDFEWLAPATVVQNFSHSVLGSGDVLEVEYPTPLSYIAWAQDDAEIAANGLFEGIVDVKDVSNIDTLQAIADGLLLRMKVRPVTVVIQTDRDGLEPGMGLVVNTARPLANDNMMVTQVNSNEIGRKFFRHQVTAINSANQATSNEAAFLQRVISSIAQPKDRVRQNIVFYLQRRVMTEG